MARRDTRFPTSRETGFPLELVVEGKVISGPTVPEFFLNVVNYLKLRDLIDEIEMPFKTSGANYLLAYEPYHPSGRAFGAYIEMDNKGRRVYVNTNHPRFFALRQGARLLQAAGVSMF